MSKRTFLRTVVRVVADGKDYDGEYHFHAFTDEQMIHVFGLGDKKSTGRPHDSVSGDFIINNMVDTLLAGGKVYPGEWYIK